MASNLTWLIYNSASGSHDDELLQGIVDALGAAGRPPDRLIDCKDGTPDAEEADRAGLELIVVHGGDGTLSRTIEKLEGFGGQVLVLPGGTFNLLSREIFGERDPIEIIDLLGKGHLGVRRRTCIRGEGVLALCELLAGPGAKWADVREELRDGDVGELLAKGWDAAATSTVGPMVALAAPAAGKEEGYAGIRMCPKANGIALHGYAAEGIGDYIQQGIAILKRDFREGPHDNLGSAPSVECRSLDGEAIPLMVDGERSEGGSTLRFSLDRLDVDLLGIVDGR
ncbi:Diacylglycerol kinase catalytic domain protein [Tsuneonella dongtanensis]|uniref:Diacylglycerol kinase catalytic domain protein n=1 Tax=Tsuneonella dongtanensis TaxID=692370 RepID=A0A1B2AAA9_9SPHN|nr:acylglycerol kinase family protein [Tsuneonella dongtanensis]ANY19041.1 Diacylglycerol kinase catalytic domain protein [Tsuneonella dongtanensis]